MPKLPSSPITTRCCCRPPPPLVVVVAGVVHRQQLLPLPIDYALYPTTVALVHYRCCCCPLPPPAVVDELFKRRKEIEWFIEGDFDVYVKRIEKPYVWGKEPELLIAYHILKTIISVFMLERNSEKLLNIATYGKEYEQDQKSSIKILFYGYGHYENIELRLPVPLEPNDFMDDVSDESDEGDAHEDHADPEDK
nr:hypothetical protein [Tanacetum cinerariifolium]